MQQIHGQDQTRIRSFLQGDELLLLKDDYFLSVLCSTNHCQSVHHNEWRSLRTYTRHDT